MSKVRDFIFFPDTDHYYDLQGNKVKIEFGTQLVRVYEVTGNDIKRFRELNAHLVMEERNTGVFEPTNETLDMDNKELLRPDLFDKDELKRDFEYFFRVAMASLCHCYDNTEGLYPDECSCEERERINEAVSTLIQTHKDLVKKYDL